MPVTGRHRFTHVVMTAAQRSQRGGRHRLLLAITGGPLGAPTSAAGAENHRGARPFARTLLAGLALALVLTGATTVLGPGAPTASAAVLPVCLPGQEATTEAGAGTPAPLGTLDPLPAEAADGGVFAGVPLDAQQVEMAATIVAVGKQMGITRRGVEIGVAVATQQSSLRPEAVNGDWLGLFQQNPTTYTQYRRTEPGGAAWMFYDQLLKQVPDYDTDPRPNYAVGDVVQKTTTGERFAEYDAMAAAVADDLFDAVQLKQDDATCAPAPAVQASTGSAFDAGNIISDAVFYNVASMSVEQIRAFLRAEGEGCTGDWCLKNLRLTTPNQPADQYCSAYQGGTNEDVATVVLKFSTACGINPQVMLTTLQKESGLLSRNGITQASYNAAWGWHCPDTGPGGTANCDPQYAGFFNQGYGMAKQWSRYRVDPQKYNYQAGETADILWNVVESGCGSAPVTIQNTATASLYNYTPYQPNAAALAAYPGTGDSCSAYGNRNFFYLFRKYFGATGGGASTTASPAVLATGAELTIPASPYVSAALAGQKITAPNATVAAGLAAGFSALGLPYVWGGGGSGAGPNNGCTRGGGDFNSCGTTIGFDCSGLTAFVLGKAGYQIPGNSSSQRAAGVSVSWAEALPGDIVGFPGHVAVYLGTFGGRPYILEASWVGTPIHIVPLTRTDFDDRLHRYWTGPAVRAPGTADFSTLVGLARTAAPSPNGMLNQRSMPGSVRSSAVPTSPRRLQPAPMIAPRPWPAPVATGTPPPAVVAPPPAPIPPAPIPPAPIPPAPIPPAPIPPAPIPPAPVPPAPVTSAPVSSSPSAPAPEPPVTGAPVVPSTSAPTEPEQPTGSPAASAIPSSSTVSGSTVSSSTVSSPGAAQSTSAIPPTTVATTAAPTTGAPATSAPPATATTTDAAATTTPATDQPSTGTGTGTPVATTDPAGVPTDPAAAPAAPAVVPTDTAAVTTTETTTAETTATTATTATTTETTTTPPADPALAVPDPALAVTDPALAVTDPAAPIDPNDPNQQLPATPPVRTTSTTTGRRAGPDSED